MSRVGLGLHQAGVAPTHQLIVGTDAFVPFIPPGRATRLCTCERIVDALQACWDAGVRAFDFSLHGELVRAIETMRGRHGASLVTLGNPSWKCGVHLGGVELCELRDRVLRTIFERVNGLSDLLRAAPMSDVRRRWWCDVPADARCLSPDEIAGLELNAPAFVSNVAYAAGHADELLLGADYADWLSLLGRADILDEMFAIASRHRPVASISHLSELVLPSLDATAAVGHFIPFGKHTAFFSHASVLGTVARLRKPVLGAFALIQGATDDSLTELLSFTRQRFPSASLLVGISDANQARPLAEAFTAVMRSATY